MLSSDFILDKIRIPFHLLHKSLHLPDIEIQLCLDVYSAEICHALRFAEDQAVPLCRVRKGIVPGWSSNPELVSSCHRTKFWFSLWKDCGCPKTGILNDLRVRTKRIFSKALAIHRKNLININSARQG